MTDRSPFQSSPPPSGEFLEVAMQAAPGSLDSTDIDLDSLRRDIARIIEQLGLRRVALNIVVVDDERMADLHQRFSGIEGTTDVLTFDLSDKAKPRSTAPVARPGPDLPLQNEIDGEVYVCVDEARRRAAELKHSVQHELLLYATHGLLHLLGYDDHDPDEHRIMHEREDQLLRAIGVGPVFYREGGSAS